MEQRRTDLALEAKELWEESAGETSELSGVVAREEEWEGYPVTRVEILDEEGEKALGKPVGQYVTLELGRHLQGERGEILHAAEAVASQLGSLDLPKEGLVLVVGLGNRAITPDAIGPCTLDSILVTRHLVDGVPEHFGDMRPVAALTAGVLGTTGVESGELVQAVAERIHPVFVVAVDALASRSLARLCSTVQISTTGIIPGSGVGNHRLALNQETLGVPVVAIGVPTVVDAATLCTDLMAEAGQGQFDPRKLEGAGADLFVTPRDVDNCVEKLGKVLGLGISQALNVDFSVETVEMLLS